MSLMRHGNHAGFKAITPGGSRCWRFGLELRGRATPNSEFRVLDGDVQRHVPRGDGGQRLLRPVDRQPVLGH